MKAVFGLFALALLGCAVPSEAAAQCSDACTHLVKNDGSHSGFGCIYSEGSNQNCLATSSYCRLRACSNVLLYTPEGQFAGMQDRCAESMAHRSRVAGQSIAAGARLALAVNRHVLIRRLAIGLTRAGPI